MIDYISTKDSLRGFEIYDVLEEARNDTNGLAFLLRSLAIVSDGAGGLVIESNEVNLLADTAFLISVALEKCISVLDGNEEDNEQSGAPKAG